SARDRGALVTPRSRGEPVQAAVAGGGRGGPAEDGSHRRRPGGRQGARAPARRRGHRGRPDPAAGPRRRSRQRVAQPPSATDAVKPWLGRRHVEKVVVVPNRLINIVTRA